MANPIWSGLRAIEEMVAETLDHRGLQKVDRILASVMEGISDTLPAASVELLREGAEAAKRALAAIKHTFDIDRSSPSYIAGRLSAAVDVLSYASFETADEKVLSLATIQPYASVLARLADRPLRNVDLASNLRRDEGQVSRLLSELRKAGAVTSLKQGRDVFNALTPVGRLVVEKGWQDECRASLATVRVHSLEAERSRYDLNQLEPPPDIKSYQIPRISATR